MQITEVRIRRREDGRCKAYASVTFDDAFVVHELRVIEGRNGVFVAMPSRRGNDGRGRDIAHPINRETRMIIESAVLSEYAQANLR